MSPSNLYSFTIIDGISIYKQLLSEIKRSCDETIHWKCSFITRTSLWTKSAAAYIVSNSFIQWCEWQVLRITPPPSSNQVWSPVQNTGTHSILPGGNQREACSIGWQPFVCVWRSIIIPTGQKLKEKHTIMAPPEQVFKKNMKPNS